MLAESEVDAIQHTDHWPMGVRVSESNKSKGNDFVDLFLAFQRREDTQQSPISL